MSKIKLEELQNYLWDAAVLLRTHIDAGSYKQYIFPLLFFKRLCDVYDEEYQKALDLSDGDEEFARFDENHSFKIPEGAHWNDVREKSSDIGLAIVGAFREIERHNSDKLQGVFGDGAWTNKNRLPDKLLKDLIEHFSTKKLTLENCPEDEMGMAYEYLIKKFADDSGHTAQEFYTNRTVVHLMTEMLEPRPGESIYDPTCGSAGMLISSIAYLKEKGEEWRNVFLYGQELNQLTAAIGKMNLFLHGVKDFKVVNDDTLSRPAYVANGHLRTFNLVLANPPYSIKQWNRDSFASDKYGRNFLGTPPQGRADYAFFQHILRSMDPKNGRCAILFPHGVLFRKDETEMRKRLVEHDLIECIIGIAPNLFYNSPMDACIVICQSRKLPARDGKILIIDASKEVAHDGTFTYLTESNIRKISEVYKDYQELAGFSKVVTTDDVANNGYSLNIPLYLETAISSSKKKKTIEYGDIAECKENWLDTSDRVARTYEDLCGLLDSVEVQ